jgi:hypothetical protein
METQNYRVHAKIRRQGEAPLDDLKIEIKSERYETDEEFCLAVAEELLELISADRDYLSLQEG